jgi:hypothetical protein
LRWLYLTDFNVRGLREGDRVEVLVVIPVWTTQATCGSIPTEEKDGACSMTKSTMLWERHAFTYVEPTTPSDQTR